MPSRFSIVLAYTDLEGENSSIIPTTFNWYLLLLILCWLYWAWARRMNALLIKMGSSYLIQWTSRQRWLSELVWYIYVSILILSLTCFSIDIEVDFHNLSPKTVKKIADCLINILWGISTKALNMHKINMWNKCKKIICDLLCDFGKISTHKTTRTQGYKKGRLYVIVYLFVFSYLPLLF